MAAWAILLALAAFQAYAQRFVISPDGVSYLDLSDAVVTGQWSRLVNLYWSPLYPVVIGIGRVVAHAGPGSEIPVIHAMNVLCFAAMLAAFEYMLISVRREAYGVRRSMLRGPWGLAAAYALFGFFALTMTPMELTTPDVLNAAAAFVAFGALLRLRDDPTHGVRHAAVLGAALGVAALAKSFMIPWGVVCFATLLVATRRAGLRTSAIAIGIWLVFVVPWSLTLSAKAGRATFGDAGRLTYAWFVNGQDPPSVGGVPPGALTARTEMILPGSGIANDTAYTDPMWADPARWNRTVVPHLRLIDQFKTLVVFHVFYVENLAPMLFLIFLIAVAPSGSRRVAWRRGWIVYVPAILGLAAYAMVVVTTRYVMPFVLSGTLVLLATIPVARRMLPVTVLVGLAIPIGLEAILPKTIAGLSLVTSMIGGMLGALLVSASRPVVWGLVAGIAMVATRVIFPVAFSSLVWAGAGALTLFVWRTSLAAVRGGRTAWFARRAEASLALLFTIVVAFRLGIRLNQDREAMEKAARPLWGNVPLNIATELAAHGITPGTRVAVIGPHAESYWARTARIHIVASVPRNRVSEFWQLSQAGQDSLLAEFASAGATYAIATLGVPEIAPDSSWVAVKFHGRIRKLSATH